ncbi:N-acetylmuramoyl-L-alanine amidase [Candidatus Gracilibacteria bacterium]|nr:N-acetylmuramoyl-L-alanine amidase [Candidatus Gracilibacteria bacterium]
MYKYAIPILSIALISSIAYAMNIETNPEVIIEKENRERIIECLENVYSMTGSKDMKKEIRKCEAIPMLSITGTASGAIVPPPLGQGKDISIECEFGKIGKIEGVEFHYTATDKDITLQAIKNSHIAKGEEHIGYHYVIKPNGEITNTRDESCVAGADKWSKNNYRFIQIAFVGDDKPTKEQAESMAELTKNIQLRYALPIDAISSHSEWGPKSKKESLEYWFGNKAEFIKKIRYYYVISIYGNGSVELQYMWRAWGDLDFIATIFAESRFNASSVGDGGNSVGYCQIHKGYQPGWYEEYIRLGTMEQKLNYCHEKYTYAKSLKGGVGSRFHGFLVKDKHINNIILE